MPCLFGTQLLSFIAGEGRAKEIIFTGKTINGLQAKKYGIVNEAVQVQGKMSKDEGREEAVKWARNIAQTISERGPIGEKMAKRAIN